MRILWVGHNLAYPPKGGVLQRNYNLLREAAKSYEIHVLAFDQPATRPDGVTPDDCVRGLQEFCASAHWLPLPWRTGKKSRYLGAVRGLFSRDPFAFHWLHSKQMSTGLKKLLEDFTFDVVHFDTLGLAQYISFVKGSAVVLNHHNIESYMMERRARLESNIIRSYYWNREARRLRKAEMQWCPKFNKNIVVSKDDEDLLSGSVPGIETTIVPNGVDTSFFTPRPDPEGRTLLFCGGLGWYPNRQAIQHFFDRIWPKLVRRIPDVEIFVVGRTPPTWLRRLTASDPRIHAPGFVEDVRPYFRRATAYVCPIRDGGGTRLKILDALAMGLPVIATPFACSGLTLEDNKEVLLAEKADDFVSRIEEVLSNTSLRKRLATAGRKAVENKYSWTTIGASLYSAYEHAYNAHRNNNKVRRKTL